MKRFTIPRDVYFGENALDQLKNLEGKKAFIVVGSERTKKDGTTDKIQANLKEAGIESTIFCGIEADPSVETVMRGAEEMRQYEPDIIVAVGGGSPIDAAKAMWIFYENPNHTFEEAAKPFTLPTLRKKAIFVAVTTTSGTGTEVTAFSIISDEKTDIKYPIADFNITPDIAIVDTNLVKSMSPELVANTGMDAITHSLEAYVSVVANPITDALALKSIGMIVDDVVKSYKGETEARDNMHIAQCMAGMSFSNAILGIVHSMAHKTGRMFGIPHGCANAIYLSFAIQYNAKDERAAKKYAEIAKFLDLPGNNTQELVASLVKVIVDLKTAMNMPHTLKDYGVNEEEFFKKLPEIATATIADPCTGTNPRTIDAKTMEKLFTATYHNQAVDF